MDESINNLQEGLQEIAGWVEENGKDGLFSAEVRETCYAVLKSRRYRAIGIISFGHHGRPIEKDPTEVTEEMFRLLEAVIPPDRPIMTRLSSPELGEGIRSAFPNPSRIVPFVSFFDSYLPHTWEIRRLNHTSASIMAICEEILLHAGFRTIQYSGEGTTPLRRLFLKTLSECCKILIEEDYEVDELDYAFPLGALGGMLPCG